MDTQRVINSERLARPLRQVQMQHARIPPKNCFYDLPTELRLAIYAIAYRRIPIQVFRNGWSCKYSSPYRPSSKRHVCLQYHNYKDLMVDKQYYNEAITLFYREAVWHFSSLDDLERFVLLAPKACRENVQSIAVLRDRPDQSATSRSQIWTTKICNDALPRLRHLTLYPSTTWAYRAGWDDIQAVYRALESDESSAKLLALRGLKSFTLRQVPDHRRWTFDLLGSGLYGPGLPERTRKEVLDQLEARIASVVCQPKALTSR